MSRFGGIYSSLGVGLFFMLFMSSCNAPAPSASTITAAVAAATSSEATEETKNVIETPIDTPIVDDTKVVSLVINLPICDQDLEGSVLYVLETQNFQLCYFQIASKAYEWVAIDFSNDIQKAKDDIKAAILAELPADLKGEKGDDGLDGLQGPPGSGGGSGGGLVNIPKVYDGNGEKIGTLIDLYGSYQGFMHLYDELGGFYFSLDPSGGSLVPAETFIRTYYWSNNDCTGDSFLRVVSSSGYTNLSMMYPMGYHDPVLGMITVSPRTLAPPMARSFGAVGACTVIKAAEFTTLNTYITFKSNSTYFKLSSISGAEMVIKSCDSALSTCLLPSHWTTSQYTPPLNDLGHVQKISITYNNNKPGYFVDSEGGIHMAWTGYRHIPSLGGTSEYTFNYMYCADQCADASHWTSKKIRDLPSNNNSTRAQAVLTVGAGGVHMAYRPYSTGDSSIDGKLYYTHCTADCNTTGTWSTPILIDSTLIYYPPQIQSDGNTIYIASQSDTTPGVNGGEAPYLYWCDTDCTTLSNWQMGQVADPSLSNALYMKMELTTDATPKVALYHAAYVGSYSAVTNQRALYTECAPVGANANCAASIYVSPLDANSTNNPQARLSTVEDFKIDPMTGRRWILDTRSSSLAALSCGSACTDAANWTASFTIFAVGQNITLAEIIFTDTGEIKIFYTGSKQYISACQKTGSVDCLSSEHWIMQTPIAGTYDYVENLILKDTYDLPLVLRMEP